MKVIVGISFLLVILLARGQIVNPGELSGFGSVSMSTWEPSDCYKPSEPSFIVFDRDGYNMAVMQFNSYLSEVKSYISCVSSEGNSDYRLLKSIIENGIQEASSNIQSELSSVRSMGTGAEGIS